MLLWVLEYEIRDNKIYLCPDKTYSEQLKHALKFESESSALKFLQSNNALFSFKPNVYSFEFVEN